MVVNKVDRPAARPDWVVDATFELFLDLGATDEQCGEPAVLRCWAALQRLLLGCSPAAAAAAGGCWSAGERPAGPGGSTLARSTLTVCSPRPFTPLSPPPPPDFPVVYASGMAGVAGPSPDELADDMQPLFDMILKEVAPPTVQVWAAPCGPG